MPESLTFRGTYEKNKIASQSSWLLLLAMDFSKFGLGVIRLCNNSEDVVWDGYTWNAFPFDVELHEITSKANIPTLSLRVSNVNRILQSYVEQTNGGVGAKITMYVVNSLNIPSVTWIKPLSTRLCNTMHIGDAYYSEKNYELKVDYEVIATETDNYYVTFTLSIPNLFLFKFPTITYMKNFCRWPFKSSLCGYTGEDTTCSHTFADCEAKGNYRRFGAFPGIHGGIWK